MSYQFLCKRGIRPARTEQFLVSLSFYVSFMWILFSCHLSCASPFIFMEHLRVTRLVQACKQVHTLTPLSLGKMILNMSCKAWFIMQLIMKFFSP